jgi:colanic acid/amylovoran biosynthesis glycosyltransferase
MRILHFCNAFSPLSETFIYDFIHELEHQGLDNYVVALEKQNADTRPFSKVIEIGRLSKKHPEWIVRRFLSLLGLGYVEECSWRAERVKIRTAVRHIRPDIIHAHFGTAGVMIAPIACELKIALVTSFHGYDVTRFSKYSFWKKRYKEFWTATKIASGVSDHICQKLRDIGAPENKILKINNGVNTSLFSYQNPIEHFDGINVDCLSVGRLTEKKGFPLLIKAFKVAKDLVSETINLKLHIIGDGPLMLRLTELIDSEGLRSVIKMHGSKSHSDVKSMMKKVHIFAQHSVTASDGDQEGLPVTLIEAAATGLPIVSTLHSGIPEIVFDGKNGYLVPEGDFVKMGERIAFLAKNPQLWQKMSLYGREHVERSMRIDSQTLLWINLYRSILNHKI